MFHDEGCKVYAFGSTLEPFDAMNQFILRVRRVGRVGSLGSLGSGFLMILPAYPAYCVYNIHARCQTLENKPSHANISMYPWNKIEHQESAVSSASPSSKSFQRTSGSRIGSSCAASHILCKVRVRIESMRQS